jgi:hypothetical protein
MLEEEKKNMIYAQTERETLMHDEITLQTVETLTNKDAQIRERGKELKDKFHILAEIFQGAHTS